MTQKTIIQLLFSLAMMSQLVGQPVKVELRIKGATQKSFWITFYANGTPITDTFKRKTKGVYLLSMTKLLKPQIVNVVSDEITLNNIFLAPDYDLIISGHMSDESQGSIPNRHLTFYGKGKLANSYSHVLDSIIHSRDLVFDRYARDRKKKLWAINSTLKLKDSLTDAIFFHGKYDDNSLGYFGNIKKIDNRYEQLRDLIAMGRGGFDSLYRRSLLYDTGHFLNAETQQDSLIISSAFRDFVSMDYLRYLNELNTSAELSNLDNIYLTLLKTAAANYTGRILEYVISYHLTRWVHSFNNKSNLLKNEDSVIAWIMQLEDNANRKGLLDLLNWRKTEFTKFSTGKILPLLRGIDVFGKEHRSTDYLNKVIYIDLWATWCGPCRIENPYLATLRGMYSSSELVIVSIAVLDHTKPWKQYIKSEKPVWEQWFDVEGRTANLFGQILLPRFMIVNQKGFIISADAPPPSDLDQLRPLIDDALHHKNLL